MPLNIDDIGSSYIGQFKLKHSCKRVFFSSKTEMKQRETHEHQIMSAIVGQVKKIELKRSFD